MDSSGADKIAKLVCEHFDKNLPKRGKPSSSEWTTLAAIVQCGQSESDKTEEYKVVSLGTGTKCLGQSELSPLGDLVSDCHAEVLARRSFLLYLYNEIDLALRKQNSIFLIKPIAEDVDAEKCLKQFILKPDVTFHLFVSHLPCGDAAIIESELENDPAQLPAEKVEKDDDGPPECKIRKVEGHQQNRTGAKLEAGPLVYEEVQVVGKCRVKPGKGPPTLCMSCSDKIFKWQLLGLQGSLLGNLIPLPIRLSSIIIGNSVPFSHTSLHRAIFNRFHSQLKDFPHLEDNYDVPGIFQASGNFLDFADTSNSSKTPSPGSIAWHLNPLKSSADTLQVIVNGRKQGATKRNFGKPPAMVDICKKNLFKRFISVYQLCNPGAVESLDKVKYDDAKQLNNSYRDLWSSLKVKVFNGWTSKPEQLSQFTVG